ncbi:heme-binding protein [Aquamicrobium sp. LC103]|uniref:GlcG/HbpS family heme-binding protein n=1 Tax=Aquamicrobium sp. LC103 TaxID=1120658 RepID=UPI00063ED321|nr:heme-binding protein [Aquamicrobium sp. LC103]TKT80347.1 heme-binding protein [Aquamicrobium sp. LC103]
MIRKLVLAAALLAPTAATAQELPTTPYLPLETAIKAAQAALEACVAEGNNVSVAVVARDGATKVLLKADNSGPHTGSSAEGKAFTSAALGRDTAGLAGFIASEPANAGMRNMDSRMVIQGGGLPVRIGDALVGGIGVGGAPSGDIDANCAAAGLSAIGAAQ